MDKEISTEQRKHMEIMGKVFQAFSQAMDGSYFYLADMKRDLSLWSAEAVEYFGLPGEFMEGAGAIWGEHIHPEDRQAYLDDIAAVFDGRKKEHNSAYRAMNKNGEYVECTCKGTVIRDSNGEPMYFAGAIRRLEMENYLDYLTGRRNLFAFMNDMKELRLQRKPAVVLLLGISRFDEYNDIYGFAFGNDILRTLSMRLAGHFGMGTRVYRMEGTKFAVVSTEHSLGQMGEKYVALQDAVKHDFTVGDTRLHLFLAGGVMEATDFEVKSHTLYSCLRHAYYESKNSRQGALVYFENEFSDHLGFISMLNDVKEYIRNGCKGFKLLYQPIVDAGTGNMIGMEALLRWESEELGMLMPREFISIIEMDKVFPDLGWWILRTAMTDAEPFLEAYKDFVLGVNLSYSQVERSDFVDRLIALTNELKFPPSKLCLEITEKCRYLDAHLLRDRVAALKALGFLIAMDDFGEGYSSLELLRSMPVDVIKIDREYIKGIMESRLDQLVVEHIAIAATEMRIKICVEGIESERMRDYLKQYPIAMFQGYLFSKPVLIDELKKLDLEMPRASRGRTMSIQSQKVLDILWNEAAVEISHGADGFHVSVEDIIAKARAHFEKKYMERVENIRLFVDPEDRKVFYVVNGEIHDHIGY